MKTKHHIPPSTKQQKNGYIRQQLVSLIFPIVKAHICNSTIVFEQFYYGVSKQVYLYIHIYTNA